MFPTSTDHSTNSLYVSCEMLADEIPYVLLHLHKGVEVPEDQDKRFAGRVQWDKDVLREGRLRLHISRLQTNDSGLYWCQVVTSYGKNYKECHLNVTAVKDRPEPETTSDTSLRGWISLYFILGILGLATGLLVVFLFSLYIAKYKGDQHKDDSSSTRHLESWIRPPPHMDAKETQNLVKNKNQHLWYF